MIGNLAMTSRVLDAMQLIGTPAMKETIAVVAGYRKDFNISPSLKQLREMSKIRQFVKGGRIYFEVIQ